MIQSTVGMIHLMSLCFWGGVVATEGVIELYSFRDPSLQRATIRLHYWIDLLVELPIIAAVIVSGAWLLCLVWPPATLHLVKLACVAVPIVANLTCIALVLRRGRRLARGATLSTSWVDTRKIVMTAVVGLPFAFAGAALGLYLAVQRMAASGMR